MLQVVNHEFGFFIFYFFVLSVLFCLILVFLLFFVVVVARIIFYQNNQIRIYTHMCLWIAFLEKEKEKSQYKLIPSELTKSKFSFLYNGR